MQAKSLNNISNQYRFTLRLLKAVASKVTLGALSNTKDFAAVTSIIYRRPRLSRARQFALDFGTAAQATSVVKLDIPEAKGNVVDHYGPRILDRAAVKVRALIRDELSASERQKLQQAVRERRVREISAQFAASMNRTEAFIPSEHE